MKSRLQLAGWGTLIGFPLLGLLVLFLFGKPLVETMFRGNTNIILQLGTGLLAGLTLGLGARWIVTRPPLKPVALRYSKLMSSLGLTSLHVYFLSFCAGFGEELFFRGAMQPLAGIWITAIFFVAIHGYLHPTNWRISIYGVYMTLAIAVLGYLTEWLGIFTACAAHMVIDVILFNFLLEYSRKNLESSSENGYLNLIKHENYSNIDSEPPQIQDEMDRTSSDGIPFTSLRSTNSGNGPHS